MNANGSHVTHTIQNKDKEHSFMFILYKNLKFKIGFNCISIICGIYILIFSLKTYSQILVASKWRKEKTNFQFNELTERSERKFNLVENSFNIFVPHE